MALLSIPQEIAQGPVTPNSDKGASGVVMQQILGTQQNSFPDSSWLKDGLNAALSNHA